MVSDELVANAARRLYDSIGDGSVYSSARRHPQLLVEAAIRFGDDGFSNKTNRALGKAASFGVTRSYRVWQRNESLQERVRAHVKQRRSQVRRKEAESWKRYHKYGHLPGSKQIRERLEHQEELTRDSRFSEDDLIGYAADHGVYPD